MGTRCETIRGLEEEQIRPKPTPKTLQLEESFVGVLHKVTYSLLRKTPINGASTNISMKMFAVIPRKIANCFKVVHIFISLTIVQNAHKYECRALNICFRRYHIPNR